jgi:hydrogenase maturation protein HypF
MNEKQATREFHISGLVQGVGFRPFVASLAKKHALGGWVRNAGGIVTVRVNGTPADIARFKKDILSGAPAASSVQGIRVEKMPPETFEGFMIAKSSMQEKGNAVIPPDLPLCEDCRQELYDPENRRYRNPFISCVACGPRYSMIDALPYDRCRTAMDAFEMCAACAGEYHAGGRRDFAQTISCNDCGPYLIFRKGERAFQREEALQEAVRVFMGGGVVAVKGIGGYHFSCRAARQDAVRRLRLLKQRDKKPFAVMFKSAAQIKEYCAVSPAEEKLLASSARPIVLLPFDGAGLADEVCAESRYLGAFLPYTPLQELLLDACGPLVMTSANVTGEPILKEDEAVLAIKSPFLDGILLNSRRIVLRLDDPVMRVAGGRAQVIRRGRGMVPMPISLPLRLKEPVFAAGGDLKAAFCFLDDSRAYLSQYLGDLEEVQSFQNYKENMAHMKNLLDVSPKVAALDMHPDYKSAGFARSLGLPMEKVQHHHAHVASVCAEHGIMEPVIGVAFDGTGYGDDGAVWGGEFLVCQGGGFERAGHLAYVPIAGGDAAARDARLCALSYMIAAKKENWFDDERFSLVRAALAPSAQKPAALFQYSSSMGRLFDAAAAITGVKEVNSFEGECAIALENLAWRAQESGIAPYFLQFEISGEQGKILADQAALAGEMADAVRRGIDPGALALGFHRAAARMVTDVCIRIREKTGIRITALSGGVFANRMLLEECINRLETAGFSVYVNEKVPMNDGGLALGQAFAAALKNGAKGI